MPTKPAESTAVTERDAFDMFVDSLSFGNSEITSYFRLTLMNQISEGVYVQYINIIPKWGKLYLLKSKSRKSSYYATTFWFSSGEEPQKFD